jgi:transcriptional repressor NrdR
VAAGIFEPFIMKCPYCGNQEDKVIDSRSIKGGEAIRRRRECLKCGNRFTSYEEIDEVVRMVVKKDGRREPFDRAKIRGGLLKAVEKREIPIDRIERIVHDIEAEVFRDRAEVPTRDIGELVMHILHELDEVAYVRFASVYRQFSDITEFMNELKTMLGKPGKAPDLPDSKPRREDSE